MHSFFFDLSLVFLGEDHLGSFGSEKFADGDVECGQNIQERVQGNGADVSFQLGDESFGKICTFREIFLGEVAG